MTTTETTETSAGAAARPVRFPEHNPLLGHAPVVFDQLRRDIGGCSRLLEACFPKVWTRAPKFSRSSGMYVYCTYATGGAASGFLKVKK